MRGTCIANGCYAGKINHNSSSHGRTYCLFECGCLIFTDAEMLPIPDGTYSSSELLTVMREIANPTTEESTS